MLIEFQLSNWLTFAEEQILRLEATPLQNLSQYVKAKGKRGVKILPAACIFGPNSAGKSNLLKALAFVKGLVLRPRGAETLLQVRPFRLDSNHEASQTTFKIKYLAADGIIYCLTLSLNNEEILREELSATNSRSTKILYSRDRAQINFSSGGGAKHRALLEYAARGTAPNQLFLSNTISQRIDDFKAAYDWFKGLVTVTPDTRISMLDVSSDYAETLSKILRELATGVEKVDVVEIPALLIPDEVRSEIEASIRSGVQVGVKLNEAEYILVGMKGDELKASKIVTTHIRQDGKEVRFNFIEESDGVQRIIELGPVLMALLGKCKTPLVLVVDELDRGLHTLLTSYILRKFKLNVRDGSQAQLIFTSHDAMLIDDSLLREDEIVIVSRSKKGLFSKIKSLKESRKIRSEKALLKMYLNGELGGIPQIKLPEL